MTLQRLRHRRARRRVRNDTAVVAAQFAHRLSQLRASAGETQRQVADRLGMTESMISRLERGDHVPSIATLCRIADAFGRQLEIVFHDHEHVHADGTRHSHPHSHLDPEHQHSHPPSKPR
jgi:transcriptional regulator with XRE-family HTH domain